MASIVKFTDTAVCNMLRHNDREILENSNSDIDTSRSDKNYSIPMDHGRLTDFEYYQKIKDERYLYGRGTAREKDAITAAGWVVTCPKEIEGDAVKEQAFFKGVYDFVAARYGEENIINNAVHYDEGGSPHIHIVFVPTTKLDHDQVQYKTVKTKTAVQTESGRYEYSYRYKKDENGERIPLKNYARMTDYYDEKIAAAEVINKAELQHFHQDLQSYLTSHGIEGAVVTGTTGGKNMTVKSLKEFTRSTGLTLEDVRDMQMDREQLQVGEQKVAEMSADLRSKDALISRLQEALTVRDSTIQNLTNELQAKRSELATTKEASVEKSELRQQVIEKDSEITRIRSAASRAIAQKDQQIQTLTEDVSAKEKALVETAQREQQLQKKIRELEQQHQRDQERISDLEKEKETTHETEQTMQWGSTSSWGRDSSWGKTSRENTITFGED